MNNAWYPFALDFVKEELEDNGQQSGMTILSNFVETNRNEYFPDLDISEIEDFVSEEFECFQAWLKTQNLSWLLFGARGKWNLKTQELEDKIARESEIFNIDSKLNISEADKKLLSENEINLNSDCIELYERLFYKLSEFNMPSEIAECAYRLAICHENVADISNSQLIKVWSIAAEKAGDAKNKYLAYKAHVQVAELYKLNSEHLNAAINFEEAFNNRDQTKKSKDDLRVYTRLARYSRVQYDLDGDHKSASRMFVHEKNTEKEAAGFLEKLILNLHKYTSFYGELPILVCGYMLVAILLASSAFYFAGTSDFCPSSEIGVVAEKATQDDIACDSSEDNIGNSIYMSIVTFTTLGYGEITPVNVVGKVTSILLSFLGVILSSLFMVTFVRKYSRP
ncbi:two pore domain potassium channel family protein [Vibrio campbellii]|uniref:potassium channel family protein n=1 Tax=Vibrio sp. LB10LO1 TaxID=2711207 RepID=UPI001389A3E8|nr:potassium channel family protein [Vibrio sp. LB10LO1]NDJ81240.1 two pore domain potassium channel family protein [Vibrio sp. LB10LO1]